MQSKLQQILQQPSIWRGRDHAFHSTESDTTDTFPSGHPELDRQLPTAGWPLGALTEILFDHPGQGELQLLIPSLETLTRAQHSIALIDPPWIPYAPALAAAGLDLTNIISIGPLNKENSLWTLEQVLRAGHCRAVLAWPENNLSIKALRRLQLAAETGKVSGFLFRSSKMRQQHSPAALRIQLNSPQQLNIIKCRGRHFTRPLNLAAASTEQSLRLHDFRSSSNQPQYG